MQLRSRTCLSICAPFCVLFLNMNYFILVLLGYYFYDRYIYIQALFFKLFLAFVQIVYYSMCSLMTVFLLIFYDSEIHLC